MHPATRDSGRTADTGFRRVAPAIERREAQHAVPHVLVVDARLLPRRTGVTRMDVTAGRDRLPGEIRES